MSNTYLTQLDSHKLWIDSEGRLGEQLSLDEVDLNIFSAEQIKLFTDVFLSGCFLNEGTVIDVDFFLSQINSCIFAKTRFTNVSFEKCEINYSIFNECYFTNSSLRNGDFYDCKFSGAIFSEVSFAGATFWNPDLRNTTLEGIDFEQTDITDALVEGAKFKTIYNLEKAFNITLNIGSEKSPILLTHEQSVQWINEHQIM